MGYLLLMYPACDEGHAAYTSLTWSQSESPRYQGAVDLWDPIPQRSGLRHHNVGEGVGRAGGSASVEH